MVGISTLRRLQKRLARLLLVEWYLDRRRIAELQALRDEMDDHYSERFDSAKTTSQKIAVGLERNVLSDRVDLELVQMRSKVLRRRARRWLVDIPADAWASDEDGGQFIGASHHIALLRAIVDARRAAIRWYVDILLPFFTLILGIIGALTGLFAILNKSSN